MFDDLDDPYSPPAEVALKGVSQRVRHLRVRRRSIAVASVVAIVVGALSIAGWANQPTHDKIAVSSTPTTTHRAGTHHTDTTTQTSTNTESVTAPSTPQTPSSMKSSVSPSTQQPKSSAPLTTPPTTSGSAPTIAPHDPFDLTNLQVRFSTTHVGVQAPPYG